MRADGRAGLPLALGLAVALTGCTTPAAPVMPAPITTVAPSAGPLGTPVAVATPAPQRPFTLMTGERPSSLDPALADTDAEDMVALATFQRVLAAPSGGGDLKPDAGDCLFTEPTVYQCTLSEGLQFSNGHALTSSDVKFSIERLRRLAPGSATTFLLGGLTGIDTPNALTVSFRLAWPDTQFGYALAAPAASIVDEEAYDADKARSAKALPFGSGPFTVSGTDQTLTFTKNTGYDGAVEAGLSEVVVQFADSSQVAEQALSAGSVDAVWRALDAPARSRIASGLTPTTARPVAMPGVRPMRLSWDAASKKRGTAQLRGAVATALQTDRTSTALVPPRVTGSVASFVAGGTPESVKVSGSPALVLGYISTTPDAHGQAVAIAARLTAAGFDVAVKADPKKADLWVTNTGAPVDTPIAWLEPYLSDPLAGSATKLATLSEAARTSGESGARLAAAGEIQRQAAVDDTVLPLTPGDQTLFVAPAYHLGADAFGPSWQLGLWGFDD